MEVEVLTLQEGGALANDTYLGGVLRTDTFDIFASFTICFWLKLFYISGPKTTYNAIISAATDWDYNFMLLELKSLIRSNQDRPELMLQFTYSQEKLNIFLNMSVTEELQPRKWHHMCLLHAYEEENSTATSKGMLYFNGRQRLEGQNTHEEQTRISQYFMIFGQEQDSFGGGFQKQQSFSGQIGGLAFWKRALTSNEVQRLSQCDTAMQRDQTQRVFQGASLAHILSLHNADITTLDLQAFCKPDVVSHKLLWLYTISYNSFHEICSHVGTLPVVSDEATSFNATLETIQTILDHIAESDSHAEAVKSASKNFLLRNLYDFSRHVWYDPLTNETMPLIDTNPYDGLSEASMIYETQFRSLWKHVDSYAMGLCEMDWVSNIFYLDGICKEDPCVNEDWHFPDTIYYIYGTSYGHPYFRGWRRSEIFYDPSTHSWTLVSLADRSFRMRLSPQDGDYLPFGRHLWSKGDEDTGELNSQEITLSYCPRDSYVCKSGQCIDISERCNNILECADMTDELNCSYLNIPHTYSKDLPPSHGLRGPARVGLLVTVKKIPLIDTFKAKFDASLTLQLAWLDSRVSFENLNEDVDINTLNLKDLESLWTPSLKFSNALSAVETLLDGRTTANVEYFGKPKFSIVNRSQRGLVFDGSDCVIRMARSYFQEFICEFQLSVYPFDTQVCTMEFENVRESLKYVHIHEVRVEHEDATDKVEYKILKLVTLLTNGTSGRAEARVLIVIQRQIEYHITNTFLQTFLLLGIGFLTLFFDIENFTDRIMVTLTTMLVIATITSSIQGSLPKTSYFKLIDIWLIFSLNFLILILIFHTYLATVLKRKEAVLGRSVVVHAMDACDAANDVLRKRASRINNLGKGLLLFLVLCFNAYFWHQALKSQYKTPEEFVQEYKASLGPK